MALSAYFHRLFAGSRFEFVFTSSQVAIEGTLAVERVDYEASAWTRQEGVPQRDYGKGVHVYRQQRDGSWQLLMDIWNSDASA